MKHAVPEANTTYNTFVGVTTAGVAFLVGGIDKLIISFTVLMVVDYFTGVLVGGKERSVSSKRAYKGIKKKAGMIFAVILAQQLDYITNGEGLLRNAMLMLLIATEGISITENLGKLGVPIPQKLLKVLEQFTADSNQTDSTKANPSDKIKKEQ